MEVEWIPRILGIGGTTRPGSSSERALRAALQLAEDAGAQTDILLADDLEFPAYAPERGVLGSKAERMLDLARRADGVIVASPGFHGGPSGLIKNALDHLEELRADERPYLDGRAIGCIVCAAGWQATATTLAALRSTVHALRGWPTPLGVTINSTTRGDADPIVAAAPQLGLLVDQVIAFAHWRRAAAVVEVSA
ncbi:putative NADPH-dependent FMN reductase [Mycolicibacterium brisbanense]|uniref:Putative NADPH-dependent FMN reductase n=1 Tax=Mycolicibacterium brisbanense TaxID=146020 RepID=A0A100W4R5_9MYCO|nr:NAD(P)H-dependent oxidoreductase [Mycolicibacterium brisbanense]GAS91589.1 putative NADPH-dependent FMN reductase [Mycolicibacterium brisbanense]